MKQTNLLTEAEKESLLGIRAEFRYARPMPAGTRAIAVDHTNPASVNIQPEGHEFLVRNARPVRDRLSLDQEGFILFEHHSKHANFSASHDIDTLRAKYLPEMGEVIKEVTGASYVLPRDQSLRLRLSTATAGVMGEGGIEGVANRVHRDYTIAAAMDLYEAQIARGSLPKESYSRFAIIQAWRVLSPPPHDFPLAMVDSSSVDPQKILTAYSVYGPEDVPGNVFESSMALHDENHRWFHFPEMQEDEVIIFKGHDTLYPSSMYALHAAFDNRRFVANAHPRSSVEARFFVFFD